MRTQICAIVFRIWQEEVLSWCGSYLITYSDNKALTVRVWYLLPWSTTYREVACSDVIKRRMTPSFCYTPRTKNWCSIAKTVFCQALFPKLCIRITFSTQNDGYCRTGDPSRNSVSLATLIARRWVGPQTQWIYSFMLPSPPGFTIIGTHILLK